MGTSCSTLQSEKTTKPHNYQPQNLIQLILEADIIVNYKECLIDYVQKRKEEINKYTVYKFQDDYPLNFAIRKMKDPFFTVKTLLENGADPNIVCNGYTPLFCVLYEYYGKTKEMSKKRRELIKILLDNKANPNYKNDKVGSIFSIALRYDCNIMMLIRAGVDPDDQDEYGNTNFMQVIEKCGKDARYDRYLHAMIKNAHLEIRNKYGRTALMIAILKGSEDTVITLLNNGANVNAVDNEGFTPLMFAVACCRYRSMIALLLIYGADRNMKAYKGYCVADKLEPIKEFVDTIKKHAECIQGTK